MTRARDSSSVPVSDGEERAPGTVTVVGIGASAGGLQALRTFFESVHPDGVTAYVVIIHLDPDHASELVGLIQHRAHIPVQWASEALEIAADHIYVIPPGQELRLSRGTLRLKKRSRRGAHAPIDLFFRTLADACGTAAAGVVLSGTGQDGASGLRRIKEAGGVTAAQDPKEAEFEAMPLSAIATGIVDIVLPAGEIAEELRLGGHGAGVLRADGAPDGTATVDADAAAEDFDAPDDDDEVIGKILGWLRSRTGNDFRQYKRTTVRRRIRRRASFSRLETLAEYHDLLRRDAGEVQALLKDLMISVSAFFRDREAFEALERDVIPRLFQGKSGGDRLRVWIPGCATGEEVYSIAILLAEHAAGLDEPPEIQIFASDIDEGALAATREARYPLTIAADVSPERLDRYFAREEDGYRVVERLRDLVLVAKHNLLTDAPFSRLDLISCRNVLIYFVPEAQTRSLEIFHYALRPSGYLFLGASESVHSVDALYTARHRKHRIFQSAGKRAGRRFPFSPFEQDFAPAAREARDLSAQGGGRGPSAPEAGALHFRMLEAYAPPSLVVDDTHEIVHLSPRAGEYLRIGGGEPTRDLLELARGELRIELRTALYQALRKGRATRRLVRVQEEGGTRPVHLVVRPLKEAGEERDGDQEDGESREVQEVRGEGEDAAGTFALVIFEEVLEPESEGDSELPSASRRRDDAMLKEIGEELRKTRAELREVIEEREGIVEEYQSAVEELQSINEEQSVASEELETSREELQSTNEELVTVNQEHRNLIAELNHSNADLRNLINATSIGTVFLDRELRVRRFTPTVTHLFNLLESDVGRPLSDLSHRVRDEDVARDAEQVLKTLAKVEREVQSEDGRWYTLRIIPYSMAEDQIDGVIVTFFDITRQKRVESEVREMNRLVEAERARLEEVLEYMPAGVLLAEASSGRVLTVNQRLREILHEKFTSDAPLDANSLVGSAFHLDGTPYATDEWPFTRAARGGEVVRDETMAFTLGKEERVTLLVSAAPLGASGGGPDTVIMAMTDISARREMEEELLVAKEAAERANLAQVAFMATVSHELRTPLNSILGYADLLLLTGTFDEDQSEKLERIKVASRHLTTMIEEILAFERLEEGDVSIRTGAVEAGGIAREAAALVEPEALDKGLALHLDLPKEGTELMTDGGKVRQVLVNLMGNAIRFTDEGEIRLSLRAEGDRVLFKVRDTGVGIAPECQEHIFDRYWQAGDEGLTRRGGGVGIGLSVARRLSRLLGGDVEVESELGRGSTFTLWLPLVAPLD